MDIRGTYYRWTRVGVGAADAPANLVADILGADTNVLADPKSGMVSASIPKRPMSPDEARMIGVRLIEAAVLADDGRSIRTP